MEIPNVETLGLHDSMETLLALVNIAARRWVRLDLLRIWEEGARACALAIPQVFDGY